MTPLPAQADPRGAPAMQLEQAYREAKARGDANAACQIGNRALRMGLESFAREVREEMIGFLGAVIARGDVESALLLEAFIYESFVKAFEDEDHYEKIFSRWREPMAAFGRRFREPMASAPETRGIAFVLPALMFGHAEVLFRLLENRDRGLPTVVYSLGPCQQQFLDRAQALGVPVVELFRKAAGILDRLRLARRSIAAARLRTAVWVSVPTTVTFAFAMGLAPVQVMWTLRYHSVRLPEIDGYITYGSWGEDSRVFHGQRWTVSPVPLALDPRTPPADAVRALRAKFPEKVLLGTLAREEKIDSRPFLESVAAILRRNPQCGYAWTGREMHPGIASFFEREGVAARCHFVGWVDTPLYAAILDVFLETFPLGCGITGYQAMGAGVPLVSYLDANTVFGMQYWHELMARAGGREQVTRAMLDEYPLLCALDPRDYVELATRAVNDESFRDTWRERERLYYAGEIAGIARYSKRFFEAIEGIAPRKAA